MRLTLLLLFVTSLLSAQDKSVLLSGRIVMRSGKPVEFASVMAKSKSDSTLKFVTATDSAGNFSFENISPGPWMLRSSFIGFDIKDTSFTVAAGQQKVNMGNIRLSAAVTNLKEVTVTGEQQKAMEFDIDKKVYNVGQDISAESGSASDVLRNIPSVQVDIDGNVSLRGSGNILILVNGKPSPIMAKNAAEALQNFPANTIEKIEIITNPSAKYRPDGMGGIINIVLKKNTKAGFNGSVTVNAGNYDRYNANVTMSYKPGKWNFYGTLGLRQNTAIRTATDDRNYLDSLGAVTGIYEEDNLTHAKSYSGNAIFGVDFEADSMNTFSLSGNYFQVDGRRENVSERKMTDENKVLTEQYQRLNNMHVYEAEVEATLAWEHQFKKEDHALSVECVAVLQPEHEDMTNTYHFAFPALPSSYDNTYLDKEDSPFEVVVDYSYPFSEDAALEAGYEALFNKLVVSYYGEILDTLSDAFVKNKATSYDYNYNDMNHAAYVTYERSIEDFGFMAGLRAEQVTLKGNLPTIDSSFSNDYFSLYPSLHLKLETDAAEFGLSYSRRVNRPDGDELNPFPEWDDPRNVHAGNPKLLPEYVHSVELGAEIKTKKFSLLPTLYYRYTYNGFTTVTKVINDSILLTTEENLSNDQEAGLELVFTGKVTKWLSGNLSGNIFYKEIDASNLGYSGGRSTFSFSNNLNANITATKSTMFQLGCFYRSEEIVPQGRQLPTYAVNIGAKQELFKNRLAILLTASDIFKTMRFESQLSSPELNLTSIRSRNSRMIYIGIKYRFGSLAKKAKEEAVQFDMSDK